MSDDLTLWNAHARRTDPVTSHEAAASIEPDRMARGQQAIYDALVILGPMTDEELYPTVRSHLSPSGARTRRAELVDVGRVRDSGVKRLLASGRRAIVWEAV